MIKLGLLGKNISKSQAPNLIIKLGKEFEIDLSYELFQDNKIDNNFEEFLNFLKQKHFLGVNVTFPYKELALNFSEIKQLVTFYQISNSIDSNSKEELVNFSVTFDKDKIHNLFFKRNTLIVSPS